MRIRARPRPLYVQKSRVWKWLAIAALVVLVVVVVALSTAGVWLSPILVNHLGAVARERFGSDLQFRSMTVTLIPRVAVNAEGITFRQHGRTDVPPLFAIDHVSVEAGYAGLVGPYRRVPRMVLKGLRITVPPRDPRQPRTAQPRPHTDRFIADEMIADDSVLTILPRQAGKDPLVFDIYKLALHPGGQAAMHYKAKLRNAKPPGLIDAEGSFGPWYNEDPGSTPLDGDYTFSNADLSVFKGISGTLASKGHFAGHLEAITADGVTDTPNFALHSGGNPVHLTTEFHAIIDGTNGETLLQPVNAHFLRTTVVCRGGVVQEGGERAKTVDLQGVVNSGRLEDVIYLATRSKQPMTGALSFDSRIVIPPGDVEVVRKLRLKGHARVAGMRFTDKNIQEKMNELSDRARGMPAVAHDQNVVSSLRAEFAMDRGSIRFSVLVFDVPGAEVDIAGSYGLVDESLDFTGHARTEAKLSQMTTGLKHVLLKAVDPFFSKDGAGAVLPIRISGTREHPHFGMK